MHLGVGPDRRREVSPSENVRQEGHRLLCDKGPAGIRLPGSSSCSVSPSYVSLKLSIDVYSQSLHLLFLLNCPWMCIVSLSIFCLPQIVH